MNRYKEGDIVSFRLPKDTPPEVIRYLNEKKEETQGKGFSKHLYQWFQEGVLQQIREHTDASASILVLPLPKDLDEETLQWLQQEPTKKLISEWLLMLAENPKQVFQPAFLVKSSIHEKENVITQEKPTGFQPRNSYTANLIGHLLDE